MSLFFTRVSETHQTMKDKRKAISIRLKMCFIVCLIAFPIIIMVASMYQNSNFGLFEGFSKSMAMGAMSHKNVTSKGSNVTTNEFGLNQNLTHDNFGEIQEIDTKFKRSKNISMKNSTSTPSKDMIDGDKLKLLDGLLVSGFDESSCKSRSQSHFYHKPSPHKPSTYLISKLRKYEKLHRKCGPNTRAYNEDMKIIVNSMKNYTKSASTTKTTCKYIIWLPANGLGNQMISMASSFLYALLTDRVMLVQFEKDINGLFCEPFLNSTWLLPENFPFWGAEDVQTYQSTIMMEMSNDLNEDLPLGMYVDLKYSPNFDERFFHCDHSQYLLSKIPLLFLEAGQYFVPSFFMTPIFEKELHKMFPEITSIFHHLGRYLFHPSNEAWEQITSLHQQRLAKANERIGLQIRVVNPNSTPHHVVMNQILNCTLENKLLPKVVDAKSISGSTFSDKKKTTTKTILVTSLFPQYGEYLKTMYMNKSTDTGELIEVYQPSGEGEQKFGDNKHNMKAWVDIYLLSLCDVLVTTYRSTFGYVAKGLGNSIPWILYNPNHSKEVCEREFNLEPCYHYPPRHYCNGKAYQNVTSSFPFIKHCKDFGFGVKLVNVSV